MGTPASGRWIVAATLAAAVAACAWFFATTLSDDGSAERSSADDVPAATPSAQALAARRAGDAPAKGADAALVPAVVDVDDAPLPEGAKATVRGTVRDDLGEPVAGATVAAIVFHTYAAVGTFPETFEATTDASGRYELDELDPAIVWRLEATARRHAAGRPASAVVLSTKRLEATYDFVLPRNGAIDATVLGADGTPVPHSIRVLPLSDDPSTWGIDEESLAPGGYRVVVDSPGRASECRVVDVAAGETTHVEFRLADEAVITGAVLDSDGTPLAKYGVVALSDDGTADPFPREDVSAADGTFRIGGLRHAAYRLVLGDTSYAADTPGRVVAPASGVRVQLRDDARVTFRLAYPADFTASDRSADVRVDVSVRDGDLTPSPSWDLDAGSVPVPGGEDAMLAITVIHCFTVRRRVNVRPGETLDIGVVRPERAGQIAGRVVDAHGEAVPEATVRVEAAAWVPRQLVDWDGSFRLDRLPRDGCVLVAEAPGYVPMRVVCPAGPSEPKTVVLQRGGALWVHGETSRGAPAHDAAVRIVDAQGAAWPFVRDRLDDHGEAAARVPPGRWRVEVAGCAPADADVREGATTTVRVVAGGR